MMHMGMCSVPHENFLLERQEEEQWESNTSKTCLFRIRLQFAYIWTSLLPPHPPSFFIWESTAKKARFPKIASSLKVSQVFNSEKSEIVLAQRCLSGGLNPPVYNPLHLCNYQDHQQRVAALILQLCHPLIRWLQNSSKTSLSLERWWEGASLFAI